MPWSSHDPTTTPVAVLCTISVCIVRCTSSTCYTVHSEENKSRGHRKHTGMRKGEREKTKTKQKKQYLVEIKPDREKGKEEKA